jgi:hypothetical protein
MVAPVEAAMRESELLFLEAAFLGSFRNLGLDLLVFLDGNGPLSALLICGLLLASLVVFQNVCARPADSASLEKLAIATEIVAEPWQWQAGARTVPMFFRGGDG